MGIPSHQPLESVARPKQARSAQTLYRILEAAETLIEEKGLADASIPEIVRRAGSSVGGFYARFRDKAELLRALEERFFLEVTEKLERLAEPTQWRASPVRDIVVACVHELVGTVRERAALIRAFMSVSSREPEFVEHGLRLRRRTARRVGDLLLLRRDELGHPEPELAIDLGVQIAFAFMLQHATFGGTHAGGRSLGDRDLEREIARIFLSYLGVEPAPAPTR